MFWKVEKKGIEDNWTDNELSERRGIDEVH